MLLNVVAYYSNNYHFLTDLLKALLDIGSVNTFQRARMENMFQWTNVMARCYAAVARQWTGEIAITWLVYSLWSVQNLYNEDL
jgi:hypothetical protein